ncbi:SAM-dependent methyltransferase [Actinoplanes sp. NPDC051513]|uniref:SAM-dependent methyltransferase n=1 Tax=Actinoplanes sp. NPDC051513 TaxID=3363908 RepID=UPI0037B01F0C
MTDGRNDTTVGRPTAQNPDGSFAPRDGGEIAAFFDGLELVDPGLASVALWHAEGEPRARPAIEDVACNGLVARVR